MGRKERRTEEEEEEEGCNMLLSPLLPLPTPRMASLHVYKIIHRLCGRSEGEQGVKFGHIFF